MILRLVLLASPLPLPVLPLLVVSVPNLLPETINPVRRTSSPLPLLVVPVPNILPETINPVRQTSLQLPLLVVLVPILLLKTINPLNTPPLALAITALKGTKTGEFKRWGDLRLHQKNLSMGLVWEVIFSEIFQLGESFQFFPSCGPTQITAYRKALLSLQLPHTIATIAPAVNPSSLPSHPAPQLRSRRHRLPVAILPR